MKKEYLAKIKETLYSAVLPNGLSVYLLPKEGFSSTFGAFATKFGSLKSLSVIDGVTIPKGVAHFLEHRLFDYPQGDLFDLFSKQNADINAYTTYETTVYHFTCTNHLEANINLLLDFVQTFSMKEEAVENEKDIICQELAMYDDYPITKLFNGIKNNLFFNHPIKDDIGGDEESVRSTNKKILELTHSCFYHPSNMIFVLCGNFDPQQAYKIIEENQAKKHFDNPKEVKYKPIKEPLKVVRKKQVIKKNIAYKKVAVGYKMVPLIFNEGKRKNCHLIAYTVYLSMLFGRSSKYYQKLVSENIIVSNSLSFNHDLNDGYNYLVVAADVLNEAGFLRTVKEAFLDDKILNNIELFNQKKNSIYGASLRSIEMPSDLALEFLSNKIDGMNVMEDIKIIESMTIKDIQKAAKEVREGSSSTFTIATEKS